MLLYGSATRVDTETTLGEFLSQQLPLQRGIQGMAVDAATKAALIDEIWNADANQHLRQDSPEDQRGHIPSSDSTSATLRLYPDEWVYLPIVEQESPGWRLRKLPISTNDAQAACDTIGKWATQEVYILPSTTDGLTSDVVPSLTPETLQSYLYNSGLRTGNGTDVVYFYAASSLAANIDVPPSTPAGGSSQVNGRATPSWLLGFWHYIDRIRALAKAHADNAAEVQQLTVDGRISVASVGILDRVLAIYERDCPVQAPPSGILDAMAQGVANAYSPDHGMRLDIHALRAALPDLRSKARAELVDSPTWPALAHFQATLAQLDAIESEAAFTSLYSQFDTHRALYPKTEQAFELAVADFVTARAVDPNGTAAIDGLLSAFMKGQATASPFASEIAKVFTGKASAAQLKATDETSAIANLTALAVGNTPGPAALWVALTRLHLVRSIGTFGPKGAGQTSSQYRASFRDYMAKLGQAVGVSEEVLLKFDGAPAPDPARLPGKLAKAFAAAANGADKTAAATHSGWKLTTGMGIINLWGVYAGLAQAANDNSPWDEINDGASVLQAGTGLAGDVVQVLATPDGLATSSRVAKLIGWSFDAGRAVETFGPLSKFLGDSAARLAFVVGAYQIVRGIQGGDWTKVALGSSSVLMSAGYWADVFVTRRASLFAAETALEMAGLAIDVDILLGLGSCLNIVGILIGVIAIAATHQDAILAIAYALAAPGPQTFVDTFLDQLARSAAFTTVSAGLKSSLARVKAAADQSTFVSWAIRPEAATELQGLGLTEDDLGLLRSLPKMGGAGAF